MIKENGNAKIVVLHVVNKMDRAGAETLIMNIMRGIDKTRFCFKFLVKSNNEGQFDSEIKQLGGEIYRIKRFNGLNLISYKNQLVNFFSRHQEIDIVHSHQGSSAAIDTLVARKFGIKTIAHSHNTYIKNSLRLKEVLFKVASFGTRFTSDVYIGCSKAALLSRYGKKIESRKKCYILNNGIDINKFSYSSKKREIFRNQWHLKPTDKAIVFIGRLTKIKNPIFALNVFGNVTKSADNFYLFLAGDGPLKAKLKQKIVKRGFDKKVFLLGNIKNVDELMSSADILIMPSLKEGFPVVLVESQCSGLNSIISDRITKEVKISDKVIFCPISKRRSDKEWAEQIVNLSKKAESRGSVPELIKNNFDSKSLVSTISSIYLNLVNNKNEK